MSSKNVLKESLAKNISSYKNNKFKNKKNRFITSKPSFLKKSSLSSFLNSSLDVHNIHLDKSGKNNKNRNSIEASLSIKGRKNQRFNKLFNNNKKVTMKKTFKTAFNKFKNLNNNNITINYFKSNITMQNNINLNNTNKSFFRKSSKSKSIEKNNNIINDCLQIYEKNVKKMV